MIDSATTIDRDDAIVIRRLVPDSWSLTVHIADVASGVPVGSRQDAEAFSRGETRYAGTEAIRPMLPRSVERRQTLAAGTTRSTLSIGLTIDRTGSVTTTDVRRAVLTNATTATHQEVTAALRDRGHKLHAHMRDASELAELLLATRRGQGALALYDLTRGWATSDDGQLVEIPRQQRTIGYVIVQECMIAANAALAEWACTHEVPVLFRNHTVSAFSPKQSEIAADFAAVVASGNTEQFELLRRRTGLVQNAAVYAPTLRGHWGLALPAYVHATSPLRRYADLVVQRAVFAHLDGAAHPYPITQLATIGEHLNALRRAAMDSKAEHFKQRTHAADRRAATTARDIGHLDQTAFHALLKRVAKDGLEAPEVVTEATRRAPERLSALDLAHILLIARGAEWGQAREAALRRLNTRPEEAASIASMYIQWNGLPAVRLHERAEGPPHRRSFTAHAALSQQDGTDLARGNARTGPTKKNAQHLAYVSLIAALAGMEDPTADAFVRQAPSLPKARKSVSNLTAVSEVNERSQRGELTDLDWTISSSGPGHMLTYRCLVHALHQGEPVSGDGVGGSKSTAKTAAASSLLLHLDEPPVSSDPAPRACTSHDAGV
ncbi:RNB domain-containing ribonuclease [Embleya sp. MST-111070]|uniref:RNB domain-containing ribonuclease n=1 Tax=Embleya sp. MST-111070 TaxID=3398231 RepID=UPI003F73A49F